jgi:multidrug resistance protein, MATE family
MMVRSQSIDRHLRRTIALALPVTLARAGLVVMLMVDTMLSGRAGGNELAYFGISMGLMLVMIAVGMGLLVGALVLTAQAHGAERYADCKRIWGLGMILAAGLGALYALLQWHGHGLLLLLGEDSGIAEGGGEVLRMWAFGMPALMLYMATTAYLEGMSQPLAGMAIALGANVVNFFLGRLLVFGGAGVPAMGAAGAALATSLTLWLMFAMLGAYALRRPETRHAGSADSGPADSQAERAGLASKILLLGLPVALSIGFETTAFSGSAIIAGWSGRTALAAYQLSHNVISFFYMLSLGLATAAAVRVGRAIGRGDRDGVAEAGWIAVAIVFVLMLSAGTAIAVFSGQIASVYTQDALAIAAAIPAFRALSFLVVLDGVQGVLMGALRGCGDLFLPTLVYAFAFLGCAIPLSYYFGYHQGEGAVGLVWGLVIGLAVAASLLAVRFVIVGRRPPLAR